MDKLLRLRNGFKNTSLDLDLNVREGSEDRECPENWTVRIDDALRRINTDLASVIESRPPDEVVDEDFSDSDELGKESGDSEPESSSTSSSDDGSDNGSKNGLEDEEQENKKEKKKKIIIVEVQKKKGILSKNRDLDLFTSVYIFTSE